MTDTDAITIHLTLKNKKTADGRTIQSCLTAGLNEARYITARHTDTGIPDPSNQHGHPNRWTGAMCYMTILDQIGSCYRPKQTPVITDSCCPNQNGRFKASAIEKALRYFSNLSDGHICALYALRNSFVHDFALMNKNSNRPTLQHHFLVDASATEPLVKLPQNIWDGNIQNLNMANATYVNLQALGDLVEEIYKILTDLHSKKELVLVLDGGEAELLRRYSFIY